VISSWMAYRFGDSYRRAPSVSRDAKQPRASSRTHVHRCASPDGEGAGAEPGRGRGIPAPPCNPSACSAPAAPSPGSGELTALAPGQDWQAPARSTRAATASTRPVSHGGPRRTAGESSPVPFHSSASIRFPSSSWLLPVDSPDPKAGLICYNARRQKTARAGAIFFGGGPPRGAGPPAGASWTRQTLTPGARIVSGWSPKAIARYA